MLLTAIGGRFLLWGAVSVLSTTAFAALYFNLYRHLGSGRTREFSNLDIAATGRRDRSFPLTPARLLVLGTAGIDVAFAIGVFAIHSVRLEDDVDIRAQRGASKMAPENTMAAVKMMASNVAVMSLKADAVKKMRSLRPNGKLGQLLSVRAGKPHGADANFLAVKRSDR